MTGKRMIAAALAVTAATSICGVTAAPAEASVSRERYVATKVNQVRAAHHLRRYVVRADLTRIARRQAARMARRHRLYHNPALTREVHHWSWVGENVGYGPTSTRVHRAFLASRPHRANVLNRHYTEIGVGTVERGGRVWVVEVFRRPG